MLLVLDGAVEIRVELERHDADRGTMAIVPPYLPYTVRNTAGGQTAHLLSLLPDAAIGSVFVAPLQPLAIQLMRRDDAPREALAG
jgi:hypothetical protein